MMESLHARMILLEFEYFVVELDKRFKRPPHMCDIELFFNFMIIHE